MNASVNKTEETIKDNMVNLLEKFRKWRLTGLGRALEEGTRQLRYSTDIDNRMLKRIYIRGN